MKLIILFYVHESMVGNLLFDAYCLYKHTVVSCQLYSLIDKVLNSCENLKIH